MSKSTSSTLFSPIYKELEIVENLDIDSIASQIESIGFKCTRCGKCCRGSFGDNSVLLNSEDLDVLEKDSLKADFVIPMIDFSDMNGYQLVDEDGFVHTFGWMLKRKQNMDCIFLEKDYRCRIYDSRPYLCRTYPFFLNEGTLEVCECEGLGKSISSEAAKELATLIVHRKSVELKDTITIYEKFLESGITLEEKDSVALSEIFRIIVHDTKGISEFMSDRL
ncbi:Fe-S-cluster containining protein [Methanohalophilus levihalophilus]|uniref:YkgJ family cysteine cluster protein n=1 Tax=Methanohalophilus levihalophilus TaxID=1431282 RepID=UPI001AE14215|nr:YkgJ family cysteine cluster protein [Methanohalophilus levihalophilus]MBP2030619.1 Fe-S-cluster containining protein [Methanohalophilus levihalophilus]